MFSGSFVAIATPMTPDGAVDDAAWGRLLDFHLQNGTHGIVVGGTTGESATLTDEELIALIRHACAQLAGRIPVIAGAAGTSSTATTVGRVRLLSDLPVDGLLVLTPPYVRPTQEGLYRHFAAAAEASRVPVIAYNVPSRTACDLLPATVARLAKLPRLRGIKEAVPELGRIRELVTTCGPDFSVLSGDDATAREAILVGARGVISVTANVAPRAMSQLVAAALRGDRVEAERIDAALAPLHAALFLEPNPIPVKWALARMGLAGDGIRLPLTPFSGEHHQALLNILRKTGVLA